MNLKDIEFKTGPNPGGVVRLWLIPWQDVLSVPDPDPATGIISANISLKEGKRFYKFSFSPSRCKLSNPSAGQDGSAWYETVLDVGIPGNDQGNLVIFERMINGLFLALLDHADGSIKMAGSISSPLLCRQVSHEGGAENQDFLGTTFQFRSRGFLSRQYKGLIKDVLLVWRVLSSSAYCITSNGANTGQKAWSTLEEYNEDTGQATGNTKANAPGDPDYLPPVTDTNACPLSFAWRVDPTSQYCVQE